MADNTVTLVGNITRDPELRFTQGGKGIASFGLAVNRRYQQNGEWQEKVSFFNVTAWDQLGENAAASLAKGTRVIVTGRLEQREYETQERREAQRRRDRRRRDRSEPALGTCQRRARRALLGRRWRPGRRLLRRRRAGWRRLLVRRRRQHRRPAAVATAAAAPQIPCTATKSRSDGFPHVRIEGTMTSKKNKARAPRELNKKFKKKTSVLVTEKVEYIDYKDVNLLQRFVSDRSKIRNRRVTGNDVQQQREVANAIKNAREMALIPYTKRVSADACGSPASRRRGSRAPG